MLSVFKRGGHLSGSKGTHNGRILATKLAPRLDDDLNPFIINDKMSKIFECKFMYLGLRRTGEQRQKRPRLRIIILLSLSTLFSGAIPTQISLRNRSKLNIIAAARPRFAEQKLELYRDELNTDPPGLFAVAN